MDRFLKHPNKDAAEPPSKKQKKNKQKFREDYHKVWPCLKPGKEGFAYCSVCNSEFSIAHGGRDDCRRHVSCAKHMNLLKTQSIHMQQRVESFFIKSDEKLDASKAETLFVRFLIEHNIAISAADHAGPLFSKMFPDSDIAKKFSCGHTKANAIALSIADSSKEKIISKLCCNSFSLSTDGSNDIDDKKLYPLVVNFYDEEKGEVVTNLLSLLESADNTGEGIFNLIDAELVKLGLKWDNIVSFCSDNASTMTGRFKGVTTYISKKQPNIKFVGCPCHLIHLAAQKATSALSIDIENFAVKIFYYLEKSSKRKSVLKECQSLCNEKSHKILKHVNTRWLSLEKTLGRIIQQWEPLQKFFSSENDSLGNKNDQFKTIQKMLHSPKTKLYCFFILAVIPTFNKINVSLQKEQPCIHTLSEEMYNLYFELLVRFVSPTAISKSESVFKIDFRKRKSQKNDEELVIGSCTRAYIKNSNIPSCDLQEFFYSVRNFFCTACEYIMKKFPLEDDFYKHASVANIHSRLTASYQSVQYFVDLFKCFQIDSDQLELEFSLYQNYAFSSDITECPRMDTVWHKISQLKYTNGCPIFTILPKLMISILVVPHSNAATERVFSMVRKNQTDLRSSMNTKTLEALLISKLTMDCCYNKKFSVEELQKTKSACYTLLKSNK